MTQKPEDWSVGDVGFMLADDAVRVGVCSDKIILFLDILRDRTALREIGQRMIQAADYGDEQYGKQNNKSN